MRNHPAERARQIAAVERAGHDPALGTWPGDPGGPTGEARLTNAAGSHEDCENFRPEDCAGPMSRGADGHHRCDVHADAYADVHDAGPSGDVTTPPARRVVEIDESGRKVPSLPFDPIVLEREARRADLNADTLLAQADLARSEAERFRDLAAMANGGTLTRCPVCGAGDSDCITDGCGIDLGELGVSFTAETLLDALEYRADILYDLAADIEAQSDSHAQRVEVLREREARLRTMAEGLARPE